VEVLRFIRGDAELWPQREGKVTGIRRDIPKRHQSQCIGGSKKTQHAATALKVIAPRPPAPLLARQADLFPLLASDFPPVRHVSNEFRPCIILKEERNNAYHSSIGIHPIYALSPNPPTQYTCSTTNRTKCASCTGLPGSQNLASGCCLV
jgi:hypothetical protein